MAQQKPHNIHDETPEAWRVNVLTPAERLRQESLRAAYFAFVAGSYALLLLPFLFFSTLFLDKPWAVFDGFVGYRQDLAISNWLSTGEAVMALTIPLLVLLTRRRGEALVGQALFFAWVLAALFWGALLFYLVPQLEDGDMPSQRFFWGYFGSWFIGQFFAVGIYDITRGGKWWRAPFYASVIGFAVQSAIYFPVLYWASPVPWLAWLVEAMFLKTALAVAFLTIYGLLRRTIRPWLGLSG